MDGLNDYKFLKEAETTSYAGRIETTRLLLGFVKRYWETNGGRVVAGTPPLFTPGEDLSDIGATHKTEFSPEAFIEAAEQLDRMHVHIINIMTTQTLNEFGDIDSFTLAISLLKCSALRNIVSINHNLEAKLQTVKDMMESRNNERPENFDAIVQAASSQRMQYSVTLVHDIIYSANRDFHNYPDGSVAEYLTMALDSLEKNKKMVFKIAEGLEANP